MPDLSTEIKFLPGVGPKRSALLNKELNIFTFEDLLYYFPYKYIDRTKFYKISEVDSNAAYIQLRGKITKLEIQGPKRKERLVAHFSDGTGVAELVWFTGWRWIKDSLKYDTEYIIFGRPAIFGRKLNIPHPEIEDSALQEQNINAAMQAHYNTTEKLKSSYVTSRTMLRLIQNLLKLVLNDIDETLPHDLVKKLKLLPVREALLNIHFPENPVILKKAEYRLKFEELFYIQVRLLKLKNNRIRNTSGYLFPLIGNYFNSFYKNNLQFELTTAQKRVIKEIRQDLRTGRQMNRLLQGDVGSGKTLVALMIMLIALDNNYQACMMVPTEILANQHFFSITKLIEGLDIKTGLLTGSTKNNERNVIYNELQSGEMQILIGTHALIEENVQFMNLGLVIIDEQHRFGVAQRAKLWKKNESSPHVLVMTATPIPRTLAMTLYGDLDVSVIDELPPGRKPVRTFWMFDSKRADLYNFIRKQINEGRQIYVVYPLIEESTTLDYKHLEEGYEQITKVFPCPGYRISKVHGRMKPKEREAEMQLFTGNKSNILVATTVIEVGVDVPNATVMIIESAERFGLSQLHQLRGRVGRGAEQSYCVLMSSNKITIEAEKRLEIIIRTNDGFEISEADLQLRGPGDLEGTMQSGIPFDLKIADLGKDGEILQYAREIAQSVLEKDNNLTNPENRVIVNRLKKLEKDKFDWSEIS
jgi:ATP-dependent DNA helicase RecG